VAVVLVCGTEPAMAAAAAERIASHVAAAIAARGSALVCLTGGGTAEHVYQRLADPALWQHRIDWTRVHLFWGDERHVPPDHADSNFGMAQRAFVSRVPVPPAQVHRMRAELPDAAVAAREYEHELRRGFAAAGRADTAFDLMLLGLGEDAHIASIFPESPLLAGSAAPPAEAARVAAVRAPHLHAWRITLTPPAILDARIILVIASGAEKAEAVRAALDRLDNLRAAPAQLLRAAGGRVEWIMDAAAAARRPGAPPA
jgi:6-phosphogluconolactonase